MEAEARPATLLEAVRLQGVAEVEALIGRGANVHKHFSLLEQSLVFYAAARRGAEDAHRMPLLKLLVEKYGLDPAAKDKVQQTALFYAAREGNLDACEYLLSHAAGVDPDSEDVHRQTALFYAAARGHEAVIDLFLSRGVRLDRTDKNGRTALFFARIKAPEPIYLKLRAHLGRQLVAAVRSGPPEQVRQLLKAGADANTIADAAMEQNLVFVAATRATGAYEVCQHLVEAGANPAAEDRYKQTPLYYAVRMAPPDPQLGQAGAGPECADFLCGVGCNPDHKDTRGQTPLHWAAQREDDKCVKVLLRRGANVNARCPRSTTPLHFASAAGAHQCMKALLLARADVNARNALGSTPIFVALDAVAALILVAFSADLQHRNKLGQTALMRNAELGILDSVAALADLSVDLDAKDRNGRTALTWARPHPKVFRLLERKRQERGLPPCPAPPSASEPQPPSASAPATAPGSGRALRRCAAYSVTTPVSTPAAATPPAAVGGQHLAQKRGSPEEVVEKKEFPPVKRARRRYHKLELVKDGLPLVEGTPEWVGAMREWRRACPHLAAMLSPRG